MNHPGEVQPFVARRAGRRASRWAVREAALRIANKDLTTTPGAVAKSASLGGGCLRGSQCRPGSFTRQRGTDRAEAANVAPRPLLSPSLFPLVSLPPFHPV